MLKTKNTLWLIVLLGLALRLVGIGHGFPYIFHPDEPTIVRSALEIRFYKNPGHFDWPHLYIYLNYFLYIIFARARTIMEAVGLKEFLAFTAPIIWNDNLVFYLLTRTLTAIFGALTAVPIYFTAKKVFNTKVGLLSALALAITPFHVWHSHYSLADVPMVFFLACSLYFISGILFENNIKNYVWAGLFAGLSASTKYNGALIILGLLLAHSMRCYFEKSERLFSFSSFEHLFYAGFFSVFGFLAGTPFALFDYDTFLIKDNAKGALWQFTNVGRVKPPEHLTHFFTSLFVELPKEFGYIPLYIFILTIFYLGVCVYQKKKISENKDLWFFTILSFFLLYYVAGSEKTRAHYFFVLYPSVLIGSVFFYYLFVEGLKTKYKSVLWLGYFAFPLILSVIFAFTFYNKDTRVQFAEWVSSNTTAKKQLLYESSRVKDFLKQANLSSQKYTQLNSVTTDAYLISEEPKSGLEEVKVFDNKFRRGPSLYVYSL